MTDLIERRKRRRKHSYKTGEDIDILNEKKDKDKNYVPICDRHIDGA